MKALLIALLVSLAPFTSYAQDGAILEQYVLGFGQNADGIVAAQHDRFFGGGTAEANIAFLDRNRRMDPNADTGTLVLHVSRRVPRGTIVFALLVFGIEVRGYDTEGNVVYTKDLPGFSFGDSAPGRYTKTLRNLPLTISRLEVTFRGNYE